MAFSIDRIFFPTDFSKNAEQALPFAAEIALKTGAKLTLFHASQEAMDITPDFEKTRDQVIDDSSKNFDKLLNSLEEDRYSSLEISTIVQDGQTVTALLNQVKERSTDLIVMGTKGVTGDRNAILGSVASSVIQKSPVPVLAIPIASSLDNFKNMIFTSDYKEGDLTALSDSIDLAKHFDSSVEVLHVSDQKSMESEIKFRGFRDLVNEYINYDKISFHHEFELDFFPTISQFLPDRADSLLVMVRYKKSFWEKLTNRSLSKEMSFYSKVPLLVMMGDQSSKVNTILEESEEESS
ncbi:Nucleotide-binding universal stress protein, UspA family [Fodinibius salinus]|uniref:Nucleotide-binding universal stress protein, UspA family n=1 Tax=Fodinibius salinus TaxID=860790 RepID=A0A5D3YP02_9BACT|nr:universal stress protein [Fodinibius salinus]TYP95604.1 Nucleotide-binding universal stress protein, UspA family [Fodinibius salinus]